jgi:hypothetical protein
MRPAGFNSIWSDLIGFMESVGWNGVPEPNRRRDGLHAAGLKTEFVTRFSFACLHSHSFQKRWKHSRRRSIRPGFF